MTAERPHLYVVAPAATDAPDDAALMRLVVNGERRALEALAQRHLHEQLGG